MQRISENNSLNSQAAQRAALIAALCAACLALGKLILFLFTGSLIVALSAWDSTMDMLVSLVNRKIVKYARLGADYNHPYGHGRIESIAALGQGCLIIGGAIGIIASSLRQIYDSYLGVIALNSKVNWVQIVFFILAAFVSFFITKMLEAKGKKLNSPALLADSAHYKVDFITNIASGVGIFIVISTKNPLFDPVIAVLFSIYIIFGAYKLIKNSFNELMDYDIPDDIKLKIQAKLKEIDLQIIDFHRFRGRKSGHKYFFDFHVTLPQGLTFNEVHEIIEKIEKTLANDFDADVIVHADPSNVRLKT